MSTRYWKFVLLLAAAWCTMTLVHEAGHVLCGWSCGGTLQSADFIPWHLPYSIFEPDPYPLITLWGGPALGVLIPVAIAWLLRRDEGWLIAHFCVLANGMYLATAWITGDRYLDTTKLLEHGAFPSSIGIYCLVTIGFGYLGFRQQCVRLLSPPASPPTVDSPTSQQ